MARVAWWLLTNAVEVTRGLDQAASGRRHPLHRREEVHVADSPGRSCPFALESGARDSSAVPFVDWPYRDHEYTAPVASVGNEGLWTCDVSSRAELSAVGAVGFNVLHAT